MQIQWPTGDGSHLLVQGGNWSVARTGRPAPASHAPAHRCLPSPEQTTAPSPQRATQMAEWVGVGGGGAGGGQCSFTWFS